jgi:hypothetical protein
MATFIDEVNQGDTQQNSRPVVEVRKKSKIISQQPYLDPIVKQRLHQSIVLKLVEEQSDVTIH